MDIVLFQPQIPQNTGNIVRTCSVTGATLTLIEPLGFSTNDRWLKRAGLDYWEGVRVEKKPDLESYLLETGRPFYFLTSKTTRTIWDVSFEANSHLVFGSETSGLPKALMEKYEDRLVTIPMIEGARCLNLATSVGIALYTGLKNLQVRS
ncbi:MAG: tRNA (cytidine(34)-2'-O)-methyltransferase [Chlamydiia bacterium]|nr:tRNA (cytidine(34)-2'-O)-methyltransferase [Chlamydiia bacterium]